MKQKVRQLTSNEKHEVLNRIAGVIERKEDILFAYAYGSFTDNLPFHDIDVGVYISQGEQTSAPISAVELAGELERAVRLPVDVRILNSVPVLFLYHVFRGLLIYERNADLRAEIVERTVRRYLDIKPLIKRGIKEAFAA